MIRLPPGPKTTYRGGNFLRFRNNPLAYLESLSREFGDIAYWKLGREKLFLVNHPDLIRDVLVTHAGNFTKGLEGAKKLLGEGLLMRDGESHRRQRRMLQPAFHQERIAKFAQAMTTQATRTHSRWRDGATLDVAHEMTELTLAIVGETFFGANLESYTRDITSALTSTMGSPANMLLPFATVMENLPLPAFRRMKAGRAKLDDVVYRLIDERRASAADNDDLLSMLLHAQDEEGQDAGMTDRQVRDEGMTILIAGHETTSNALSWTWYLLSQNPDIESRLHEELDRVLSERVPTLADMRALTFTENVISESLRLYPPLWMLWRRVVKDYALRNYVAPAGSILVMSQYVMHRDARYFPDPLHFNPDRWTREFKAELPKYAYFPFGGGPRQCIGDGFAWMEAVLLLATIAQQWKLRLDPGYPVVPQPLVTLRPKNGLHMIAHRR